MLSSPIPAIHIVIKIPLNLHNSTLHVNVSIPNVNMHKETVACYSTIFLIMTGNVCSSNTVDAAVVSIIHVILHAWIEQFLRGFIRKSKFPQWFSYILSYHIWKKNYIYR